MLDRLFGNKSEMDMSGHINGEIVRPSGKVDDVKITEPDRFDYENRIYAVMEPLTNKERGEKKLVYDEAHPIPRCHRDGGMGSTELMNEISGESIIKQLATPQGGGAGGMDIIGKLKQIPPAAWIILLVVFVLLQQGSLGDLIPFF